ncbi:MAG: hypothetical protein GY754_25820 [bacterium]|nr:hypothetical protein [bacterium]
MKSSVYTLVIKIIFFLIIAASISSCSESIHGKVAVKGSEPFTYLALVIDDHNSFKIVGKLSQEISSKYQGKYIKVTGKIVRKAVGPGFPAELEVESVVGASDTPF